VVVPHDSEGDVCLAATHLLGHQAAAVRAELAAYARESMELAGAEPDLSKGLRPNGQRASRRDERACSAELGLAQRHQASNGATSSGRTR
jgi:hypothetical protein